MNTLRTIDTLDQNMVLLEIEVTRQTADELADFFRAHLWEPNDGLRLLLGAGMGALTAERMGDGQSESDKVRLLSRRMAEVEGRLAATRHELGDAQNLLRRMEFSDGAMRKMSEGIDVAVRRLHREIDELRAQVKARDEEIERLLAQGGDRPVAEMQEPASQPAKKSWWGRGAG